MKRREEERREMERQASEMEECTICKENKPRSSGVLCRAPKHNQAHFTCNICFDDYVKNYIEATEASNDLFRERQDKIYCTEHSSFGSCDHNEPFWPEDLSPPHVTSEETLDKLNNLKKRVEMIKKLKKKADEEEAAKLLYHQMPAARMCPKCKYGPVDFAGCSDLARHHNEQDFRANVTWSNACPRCNFFSDSIADWSRWDGEMRL